VQQALRMSAAKETLGGFDERSTSGVFFHTSSRQKPHTMRVALRLSAR